jgi:peptidoglycan/LPS O-acetylase OafA/YrhL
MRTRLRETLVTAAVALCLAGPVTATVLPLAPEAWRRPPLVWGILLAALALVAGYRRSRRRRP